MLLLQDNILHLYINSIQMLRENPFKTKERKIQVEKCSAGNSVKHNVKLHPFHKLIKVGCSGQQLNVSIYQVYVESYCNSHCSISRDA